jgi:glycosyltransferase involved in cell wall biosynthesis
MDASLQAFLNDRYKAKLFVNEPDGESDLHVLTDTLLHPIPPFMSIVMPIFNQEDIIYKNLSSIVEMTTATPYELILIIDKCSDNTETVVMKWVSEVSPTPLLTRILVVRSNLPLFETAADNVGFLCAKGEFCLELQADMEMTQRGYNEALLEPFRKVPNIIAVSGRCCHSFDGKIGIGKLGNLVEKSLEELPFINRNLFYMSQTVNRGPILIHMKKLQELRYLDERNFFQEYCDHDLFCRALFQKGWICGYRPIDFLSLIKDGSMRKPRDPLNQEAYTAKKAATHGGKNGFFWKTFPMFPPATGVTAIRLTV